ncbi:MotE family protein [Niallia oryzisoli]|uniref:MotE family protein n=1 Tax=Niallia oryzisoli TaxID=1737571 RepID=UPI003736E259
MEKLIEEQEEKKYSKIQWFFVVIVIPALFALTVAVLVLTVAGINVFEKADELRDKIPFVPTREEASDKQALNEAESSVTKLKAEMKDREAAIAKLEADIKGKDSEIETLLLEKEQLQSQIDELLLDEKTGQQSFNDIVNTFESISAKKAAPIIAEMNDDEALKILSSLKPDILAAILEKMNAADAAKYTALLTNNSSRE